MTTGSLPLAPGTADRKTQKSNAKRGLARSIFAEFLRNWLGVALVVSFIGTFHQLGLFSVLDGRFFDIATSYGSSHPPRAVIIERDTLFESGGADRFEQLERDLARIGVERIGYLNADRGPVSRNARPVVIGHPARKMERNGYWRLLAGDTNFGEAIESARTLPPSQYGIQRSQTKHVTGRDAPIPVFDAALAGVSPARTEFLVPISAKQSIPSIQASRLAAGDFAQDEFAGTVALVADTDALAGTLHTARDPDERSTSEALFRAYAVDALRSGTVKFPANVQESWVLLIVLGLVFAIVYRHADPKRLAVFFPLFSTGFIAAACWLALIHSGLLLPVAALLVAPWIITFQRMIERETSQDRRLEKTASHAIQTSFNRSALRDGVRLPHFLGEAARYAGVERSLVIEVKANGTLDVVTADNASLDDIVLSTKQMRRLLRQVRAKGVTVDANDIVPDWGGGARIGWIGTADQQLFWLHTRPTSATPGKSAHLLRTLTASFRELFQRRANLNGRSRQETRYLPVDNKVASAISLVATESENIRLGLDTVNTAIMIFHLIGSPLHANSAMRDIYHEANLDIYGTPLADVLLNLTDLDSEKITVLIEDLMVNGTEMRMPMRSTGSSERMLRLAAPIRSGSFNDRVLVLEAIDMEAINRATQLRKAVAKYIDLQLRNDFGAILFGTQLASDERLSDAHLRGVVAQIEESARRATGRLDKVADLVRSETKDLTEACYPVDATEVVRSAIAKAETLAQDLGVSIESEHPDVGGFTLAEPVALGELLVAMLRVVIADTPQGGSVKLKLEELEGRTQIRISGGFGIGFGRLLWLISNYEEGAAGEFRIIGEGMAKVTSWSASVSYWGSESNGFGFNIDLRGVG